VGHLIRFLISSCPNTVIHSLVLHDGDQVGRGGVLSRLARKEKTKFVMKALYDGVSAERVGARFYDMGKTKTNGRRWKAAH
jgi:hypothetical protein